jgi:hypothetical protein
MFRRNARFARELRRCRTCGSRAIAGPYAAKVDEDTIELSVRCGECGEWRWTALPADRAAAVEQCLERGIRHGRHDLEDALRRARVAGIESSDFLAQG